MLIQVTVASYQVIVVAVSFLSFIIALISLFVKLSSIQKNLIDKKLDKETYETHIKEYDKHVKENKAEFNRIYDLQSNQMDKLNEAVKQLLEQSAKQSTDLEWIKRKIKD